MFVNYRQKKLYYIGTGSLDGSVTNGPNPVVSSCPRSQGKHSFLILANTDAVIYTIVNSSKLKCCINGQTAALKISKIVKWCTKAPPPSYFARKTPEEIPLKFNFKLCG